MENTLKSHLLAAALSSVFFLTACGGGGGGEGSAPTPVALAPVVPVPVEPPIPIPTPPVPVPTVAAIASVVNAPLMYGKTATFTVTGTNFENGVTFTAPNCNNVKLESGGTATQQLWTCVPVHTGILSVTVGVTGAAGTTQIAPNVPMPQVTIKTSLGDIVLELDPNKAPLSVNNFLQYTSDGFYNDKIFHRVLKGFVIQGGGYNTALIRSGVLRAPIALEASNGLPNNRGTIAMARTTVPDSATSQFFINLIDNVSLNAAGNSGGYAVFGKVITGMGTVDTIAAVPVSVSSISDGLPNTEVLITSVVQTQ